MPHTIEVKSILNKTKRRGTWFLDDYTINPYSGCSFNCLYCYIRGSKYGTHMDNSLSVKSNAIEILEKQLYDRAKKNQYGIIVMSSATDPYLQFEKDQLLTRKILEVILKFRFPVHIITKSDLVMRDFDLLHQINESAILPDDLRTKLDHKVMITFSFSTVDNRIAKIFEPSATPPNARLQALKKTIADGFYSGVSLMPLIPFITDTSEHLGVMFSTFKEANVNYIFPATITLFGSGSSDSKTLMYRAVEKHYPHLMDKYDKFFRGTTEMPPYYRNAFYKRTTELCARYGIKTALI